MKLADMLSFADIGQLNRIASHYECECNPNSKHELIQNVLQVLGQRKYVEHYVAEMNIEDIRFLNSLIFDSRRHFTLEELIAFAGQSKFTDVDKGKENPRDVITRFRKRGWLFQGTTQHTRYAFSVPEDLIDRFKNALKQKLYANIKQMKSDIPVYREEIGLMSDDLLLFLRYVSEHQIPLNSEQAIYRQHQAQLMELFHVSEPLVGKGWRFGYGRHFKDYPSRFSLLYDYAFAEKLIREEADRLQISPSGSNYLQNNESTGMIRFAELWLRIYKGPIPNLYSLLYWTLANSSNWIHLGSLFEQIEPLIKPFYYDTSASIFEERIVRMLLHLGVLRLGEDELKERYIQITPIGQSLIHSLYNKK